MLNKHPEKFSAWQTSSCNNSEKSSRCLHPKASSIMLLPIAVVFVIFSCTHGENPAIQVALTNKGLQYGKHVGTDWIQKMLQHVTFPEISDEVRIGFLGSIHYTLTDTSITKCDLPEPSVEFSPDVIGFKTSILGLSVALSGQWKTNFGLMHGTGSFDMAIFNVDVISVVELGKDADGHLSVTSVGCHAHVGYVSIRLHGGASWIVQPIVNHYRGQFSRKIENKCDHPIYNSGENYCYRNYFSNDEHSRIFALLCPQICLHVEELIGSLEYHLQAMNVSYAVNQALTMDLSLTGSPVINVSSLNLGLKGEGYNIKTHAEPPFKAQPFAVPEQQRYMLSVGLSEFTLNSASYGYYSAGGFEALINDSIIPPGCPVHLNTSFLGPYIPQLPKLFPGLLMNLQVYAEEFPVFSLQPDAVKLGYQGAVKAFAIQPNATQTPLFKLSVGSNFSSKGWISGGRVKGHISMDNFALTLLRSEVGTFKTGALEKLARSGIEMVLAKLNEKLKIGVDLPRLKQAQLVNSVLKVEQGFIALFSDAEVLPTNQETNRPLLLMRHDWFST